MFDFDQLAIADHHSTTGPADLPTAAATAAPGVPAENGLPPVAMAKNTAEPPRGGDNNAAPPALVMGAVRRRLVRLVVPPTANDQAAFRAGFLWLNPNLSDLRAAGWTRPELFRRNRNRRGLAWLPLWADPDVTPALTAGGAVQFTIRRRDRTCIQTARPQSRCPGVTTARGFDDAQ